MNQEEEAADEHEQTIKGAGHTSGNADVRTDSGGNSGTTAGKGFGDFQFKVNESDLLKLLVLQASRAAAADILVRFT